MAWMFTNPIRSWTKVARLTAVLMAAASIGHESAADSGDVATIVSPRILEHPPAEIAPGGTVVLRGNSPARPEAPESPEATVADYSTPALLPAYGWDRRYDTSGWDRRYDNSGIDLRYDMTGRDRVMDNRYDRSGFDRRFDTSGFSR